MELNNFITNFANQFDDTDISEITAVTAFRELEEWSSLIALGVIAMAKEVYGKTITGAEIRACETVKDLYNAINAK